METLTDPNDIPQQEWIDEEYEQFLAWDTLNNEDIIDYDEVSAAPEDDAYWENLIASYTEHLEMEPYGDYRYEEESV